jgi:hypothetical protein
MEQNDIYPIATIENLFGTLEEPGSFSFMLLSFMRGERGWQLRRLSLPAEYEISTYGTFPLRRLEARAQ